MFKQSIATTITATGLILALGVAATIGFSLKILNRLEVNGPIYHEIVDSKDLIADILPPPLYVIESYSLVDEAALHPDLLKTNIDRIEILKSQYKERMDYWKGTTLPDSLRNKLENDVVVKGDQFWAELENQVVPALKANDPQKLNEALTVLRKVFHIHEKAVNELVDMGNSYGKEKEDSAAEEEKLLIGLNYTIASALLLLCLGSIVVLRRRAVTPIRKVTGIMARMAIGDLREGPTHTDRKDEIGDMLRALAVFHQSGLAKQQLENEKQVESEQKLAEQTQRAAQQAEEAAGLKSMLEALGNGLQRLANCDMRASLTTPFEPRYESLRVNFNAAMDTLQASLHMLRNETQHLAGESVDMRQSSDNLGQRTQQQASALEQTAAALEQVTSTINLAAERTRDTRNLARETRDQAEASTQIVTNAIHAMERIEQASGEIGNIISVIDEIAFQTNLLALNAGVEAARAGEAGRGFAVVAQEVRELAQKSAAAAGQIKTLIQRSGTEVAKGVELVEATGKALAHITKHVHDITTNVDAIATATSEQAVGLKEISASVNTLDQMTQKNSAMVEETNTISRAIADGAERLSTMVNRFQLNQTAQSQSAHNNRHAQKAA